MRTREQGRFGNSLSQHFKPACRHKVASASAAFKVFSYVITALLKDRANARQGGGDRVGG
jgi:hypothetical protein